MHATPRQKLLAVNGLLGLALGLAALQGSGHLTGAARLMLGAGLLGVLVAWAWRRRGEPTRARRPAPRLEVVERLALSTRTSLALVELDGRSLLIVHAEGFAVVHRLRPPRRVALEAPPSITRELAQ